MIRSPKTMRIFRFMKFPCKLLKFSIRRNCTKIALGLFFCIFLLVLNNVDYSHRPLVIVKQSVEGDKSVTEGSYQTNYSAAFAAQQDNIETEFNNEVDNQHLSSSPCPLYPPGLIGNLTIDPYLKTTFEEVEKQSGSSLLPGGCYVPPCKQEKNLAVIIPFKDRDSHLKTLLFYLHPMLMKQRIRYCVYVAEQFDFGQFNKALIMNAAFKEVMKVDTYDCIIFHDVDMIPENDYNLYRCASNPRHLSPGDWARRAQFPASKILRSAIDKFYYKPHYGTDFGGVTAITPMQYRTANGHSNSYWGWGGEDNDMEFRIRRKGMNIIPSQMDVGRYKMIPHRHSWQFSRGSMIKVLNDTRETRADTDGLSNLKYRMMGIENHASYTKILIDVRLIEVKKITLFVDGHPAVDVDLELDNCRWDFYEGKYLDKNIAISKEDMEKALNLPENEKLPVPKEIPYAYAKKMKSQSKTTTPKPIPTNITSLKDAKKICEALSPECRGILEDPKTNTYLLRHGGAPRNFVVTSGSADGGIKKYTFANTNVYLKYCPGVMGYLQHYTNPLPVTIMDNLVLGSHRYKYVIDFTVLLKPEKTLYFYGMPFFESRMKRNAHVAPFRWSKYGVFPDFDDTATNRDFIFETVEFSLPNTPGTYALESKLMGKDRIPYYVWNIWYEVKSGNKENDARIRDEFSESLRREQLQRYAQRRAAAELKAQAAVPYPGNHVNAKLNADDERRLREYREQFFQKQFQENLDKQKQKMMMEFQANVGSLNIEQMPRRDPNRGIHGHGSRGKVV